MKPTVLKVIVIAPKGHRHSVADGGVLDGLDALGGPATVDPALLEGPHWTDDKHVPPVGCQGACHPARLQLYLVAGQLDSGAWNSTQQPEAVDVGPITARKVWTLDLPLRPLQFDFSAPYSKLLNCFQLIYLISS